MRIVQLSRDMPPAPSGIGDHVALVSHEMATQGHEVVVICSALAQPFEDFDVRAEIKRWDASGISSITAAVANARPQAIIWHYNPFQIGRKGVAPEAGWLARSLARIAPLTVVAHELWYPWGRNGARGLVWAVSQRVQFRGVIRAASHILVTTDARRAHLARRFPARAQQISVVAAGATIQPGSPPTSRDLWNVPADAFLLAHVGAIGEGRNLSVAARALDVLHAQHGIDARLLLIGRTGVAPPNHPRVVATGSLDSHTALSGALSASDAYLFAEPTGPVSRKTSLLSAFAHGLPVIAYRGPATEPHFRDEQDLILVEPSEEAIARAVARLAADPALRKRLSEQGRRLTQDRYSWKAIADGILAAIGDQTP